MIYSAHCAPHKFTVYKSCKFVIITEKGGNNTKNINVNVQRPPTNIPLGRQGENLATCVSFDCTGLAQLYGDGTAELLHELKDGTVYPVAIKQDGASVSWIVTASDTATVGSGRAELRWYVGDTLAKSAKFRTSVSSALPDTSVSTPPEPQKSWVDKVLAAAQEIKDGAISDEKLAAAIAAYLKDHPIDAGLDEAALATYLVENGYLTNTALADAITQALAEAKASGQFDGAPGKTGADGSPGADGVDGVGIQSVEQTTMSTEDGGTNIVTVTKTDGSTSTFEVRNGSKGSDGVPGKDGTDGAPGADGKDGADGQPGAPGKSAYQYAVDGGYTGTETEFAAKMATEIPEPYTLPIASPTTLGGVQPVAQTADMTQPVGVNADGALFTVPGGGGNPDLPLLYNITTSDEVRWIDTGDIFTVNNILIVELLVKSTETNTSDYKGAVSSRSAGSESYPWSNYCLVRDLDAMLPNRYDRFLKVVCIKTVDGLWCSYYTLRTVLNDGANSVQCLSHSDIDKYGSTITGIIAGDASAATGDRVLGAGSTLRIWGK